MIGVSQPFKQPRFQSSQSHFAQIPSADIPRSVFNRSHQVKTTFDAGLLIPFYVDEVLPGDSFKCKVTTFARLATPQTPFMDNLYADVHFWFVPNRLVWDNWERFNGAQDNPDDSVDFLIPQVTTPGPGYAVDSLFAYFGARQLIPSHPAMNALHSRAYNLIWNQWYRDENLQDSVVVDKDNGPDSASDYVLLRRGKRRDYFTSCLPFTQKGPAVTIPLGGQAPISGIGKFNTAAPITGASVYETGQTTPTTYTKSSFPASATGGNDYLWNFRMTGDPGYPDIYADLSEATASTINSLREAFQLQRMFERDARGGTRYVEILKSHFGVTSPDFRLQRPEFLGGGTTSINTSPIPQTSSTDATSPQGSLTAMGTFSHLGVGFNKSFVEHGVVIGLISVRADMTYQQGLNKMFTRQTRFDFYWPALSHLGEEAVLNQEIFVQGTSADAEPFGYQERYADYRYKPSMVTGKFNSDYAQSLDFWHLAQDFSSLPVLGDTFIQENPPIDRVIAVPDEPHFLFDAVLNLDCARPMPVYSVPGMIDHF